MSYFLVQVDQEEMLQAVQVAQEDVQPCQVLLSRHHDVKHDARAPWVDVICEVVVG